MTGRHVGQNRLKTVSGRSHAWFRKFGAQTFLVFESREETQIRPIVQEGKKDFFLFYITMNLEFKIGNHIAFLFAPMSQYAARYNLKRNKMEDIGNSYQLGNTLGHLYWEVSSPLK